MTGDSFIMYSCQLINVTEWRVFRYLYTYCESSATMCSDMKTFW